MFFHFLTQELFQPTSPNNNKLFDYSTYFDDFRFIGNSLTQILIDPDLLLNTPLC